MARVERAAGYVGAAQVACFFERLLRPIMADLAQGLQIVRVIEQGHIAAMRHDVVGDGGRRDDPLLQAINAAGVL